MEDPQDGFRMAAPMIRQCFFFLLSFVSLTTAGFGGGEPLVWLTHRSSDPAKVVINWQTEAPAPSVVHYYAESGSHVETKAGTEDSTTLHHVEIETTKPDTVYHFRIGRDDPGFASGTFKSRPTNKLRVVIIGDLHANMADNSSAILQDDPHLIITAGDNVPSLHENGKEGVKIFTTLIGSAPQLFRSIPFMPVLGNHDKEAHPRGPKPPAEPVYDIAAKAFHEFFPLPGDGWKWTFDVADFGARFVALDLQHISDFGTTWQTCHAFAPGSEQFEWYKRVMDDTRPAFVFTIDNEQNSAMRAQAKGEWGKNFRRGSALITGFGTFNERAEWDDFPCFNTHAHGHGVLYKDPHSTFLSSEGGYLLLTLNKGSDSMTIQIKNQKGWVLDTREIKKITR
jgi:hypothetical protein